MSKKLKLILVLFIIFLLTVTFTVMYIRILNELYESLTNTIETFDIYSAQLIELSENPPLIRLNVSFCLENNEKYAVTIDLIQAQLYINNEYLGSSNPYGQMTSFDVPAGEKYIISVIFVSVNQKMIEIINDGNQNMILNGTIMGHASFFFFSTSYKRQFQIEKTMFVE
ncbi:MAG: hypothetical protein QW279_01285 [Candidatus Jordarchaeaceae archaeon]